MAKTQKSISKDVVKKPKVDTPIKKKKHLKKEEKPLQTNPAECEKAENNGVEAEVTPNKQKPGAEKKKPQKHENKNKEKIKAKLNLNIKREQFKAINYDKQTFETLVNVPSIRTQAKSLKVQIEKYQAKNELSKELQYYLRVNSMNTVNCPRKVVTINLKHALVSKGCKVLLIVGDLQRGMEYKETKKHYEDLFKAQGIENVSVLPMDKLYKNYTTLDQQATIFKKYEYFLCDGRLMSRVIRHFVKSCKKTHSIFQAVYMKNPHNLKKQIQNAIQRTTFQQKPGATKYFIHVGTGSFSATSLAQNIVFVIHQLKKVYPGGMTNIRNILLTTNIPHVSIANLFSRMSEKHELGDTDQVTKLKKKYLKALEMLHEVKSEICDYVGTAHQKKIAKMNEEVKNHGLAETDDDSSDEDDDDVKSSSDEDEVVKDGSDDDDNNEMEDEAESETEIADNGMDDDDDDEETEESD